MTEASVPKRVTTFEISIERSELIRKAKYATRVKWENFFLGVGFDRDLRGEGVKSVVSSALLPTMKLQVC